MIKKCLKKRWKKAQAFISSLLLVVLPSQRQKFFFFSVKNHTYHPAEVVAARESANSPGLVGRLQKIIWKACSVKWNFHHLLALPERNTLFNKALERNHFLNTSGDAVLLCRSPSLLPHSCICKRHLCKHENQCNNSMYEARPTVPLMSPCWTYTLSLRALRGFAVE